MKKYTVLITGGTGSFGKEAINFLLKKKLNIKKIIIFSRDEFKQNELAKIHESNKKVLRFFLGDVRDKNRLMIAMDQVDIVIHAAALKQVPATEYNPYEAIKTNILGAQNVAEAAAYSNVKKVIALSSDKATAPVNLYGATKLVSDKIFVSANNMFASKKTKFSVVRYGNVFGSRGSVVPLFIEQKKSKIFTVTNEKMTRFSLTLNHAVEFVFLSLEKMLGGEIFVPKLSSYKILDLLEAIAGKNSKIKIVGSRIGEKLHEELISVNDLSNIYEFKDYFVILPDNNLVKWDTINSIKKFKGKKCGNNFSYNSLDNKNYLSISQLKEILKKYN
jgi:UDP-N-acetylglucosamine 4,6-dehydratase